MRDLDVTVSGPFLLSDGDIGFWLVVRDTRLMKKTMTDARTATLTRVRILDLDQASESGRKPHLSAASGLFVHADRLYVIADDELGVGEFSWDAGEPGRVTKLVPGRLPLDSKQRKRLKPDWEALLGIPRLDGVPRFLAVPSGSTEQRQTGVSMELGREGVTSFQTIDFAPFYSRLRQEFRELNIEGAAIVGKCVYFLQRGNGALHENALIEVRAQDFVEACLNSAVIPSQLEARVVPVALGELDGVPLSFTDLTVDPAGRLVFLAAAEASESTYLDGACQGSVVGVLTPAGVILEIKRLELPIKAEGIAYRGNRLFCVTDADDPDLPAELFEVGF